MKKQDENAAKDAISTPHANAAELQYHNLIRDILARGIVSGDRTGTGTKSLFAPPQMRFDLRNGFPILTSKKVHFKSIAVELLSFLRGDKDARFMRSHGVTIWDEWAQGEDGWLGRIYGAQWRGWRVVFGAKIDQIANLITAIKQTPESRRHLVSAWNVGELEDMALPPCHFAFTCYVRDGRLSLNFMLRSSDVFLGLPFNIASYALLTHLLARATGTVAHELVCTFAGDTHLYLDHIEQAETLIARTPYKFPKLEIQASNVDIDGYNLEDFVLIGYQHHPAIAAPISK